MKTFKSIIPVVIATVALLSPPVMAQVALYDRATGTFLGTLSHRYDPDSINNPMGIYGSRSHPHSIHNPLGIYGSRISPSSPNSRINELLRGRSTGGKDALYCYSRGGC